MREPLVMEKVPMIRAPIESIGYRCSTNFWFACAVLFSLAKQQVVVILFQ